MAEKADETPGRPVITERVVTREISPDPPAGPNATTEVEDPGEHYFLLSDGKTKVNAFGEVKDSPEDKKRFA